MPISRARKRKSHHRVLAANCAFTLHPQSSQLAALFAHPAQSLCRPESHCASLRSGIPRSAIMWGGWRMVGLAVLLTMERLVVADLVAVILGVLMRTGRQV